MRSMFDWKYVITILVALAGVGVPVFLWQADQARSLRLDVISQTALSPVAPTALLGLKLTLDGSEVSEARLTVMEIVNNGNRPIVAIDFEAPVEITSKPPGKIVRMDLGEVSPSDLKPSFSLKDGQIFMQPFLMNSGDKARISIITSGGEPQFNVRGRIAGIKTIEFNSEALKKRPMKFWVEAATGVLLFSAYIASLFAFLDSWKEKRLDLRLLALAAICAVANTFLTMNIKDSYGWSIFELMGIEFTIALLLLGVSSLMRPKRKLLSEI